ncbi:hypothetical protein DAETH_33170 (plasmid) [Deinococcus aetherius]|uniref:Ubiquitin-like domain-containing protein n=1 Tax=Deinococcus aetherius TaxID=200252 RepID=A0ABN6RJ60_9DEIO|nr:hypothetical protein [Deinococcus aetherius]BDP43348.1 hypothetical protein DAETH_33170 [Deinococcus aetherius]
MTSQNQTLAPHQAKPHEVNVRVQYPAAEKPYHAHLDPTTTVGQLKLEVLRTFGLMDGAAEDGGTVHYELVYERSKLSDPNQTLGQLLGGHPEAKFTLTQFITQG